MMQRMIALGSNAGGYETGDFALSAINDTEVITLPFTPKKFYAFERTNTVDDSTVFNPNFAVWAYDEDVGYLCEVYSTSYGDNTFVANEDKSYTKGTDALIINGNTVTLKMIGYSGNGMHSSGIKSGHWIAIK